MSQNPKINIQGHANVGPDFYCTWQTKNGSSSVLTVSNPGSNTLTFDVEGAPGSGITSSDGKPVNGLHEVLPNDPTANVIMIGDFLGQAVTITNVSDPGTPCFVRAVVQG